jgi:murein DD-endopeptidase MepM/ murein hydrolase activator NlpD
MNLILVSRRRGYARHVGISRHALAGVAAIAVVVAVGAFLGGYQFARSQGSLLPGERIAAWQGELDEQRAQVTAARASAQEQVDALAIRMGELNAGIIRLNALGRRLTNMAALDSGEFDFDAAPALGGPEEPAGDLSGGQLPDLLTDLDTLALNIDDRSQQLSVLESLLLNRKLHERVHPQGRPVRSGWVSSYYGRRSDPFSGKPAYHKGIDFTGKAGTEVIAVAAGVVTWSRDRYGYGKMIEVNHGNGYFTRYAHNSDNLVAVGDYVQQGQTIALMGSTGRATGPNLHFEVWHHGKPVNPAEYVRE